MPHRHRPHGIVLLAAGYPVLTAALLLTPETHPPMPDLPAELGAVVLTDHVLVHAVGSNTGGTATRLAFDSLD